jgi:hypothetical protein
MVVNDVSLDGIRKGSGTARKSVKATAEESALKGTPPNEKVKDSTFCHP